MNMNKGLPDSVESPGSLDAAIPVRSTLPDVSEWMTRKGKLVVGYDADICGVGKTTMMWFQDLLQREEDAVADNKDWEQITDAVLLCTASGLITMILLAVLYALIQFSEMSELQLCPEWIICKNRLYLLIMFTICI